MQEKKDKVRQSVHNIYKGSYHSSLLEHNPFFNSFTVENL